uniref:Protein kinase domain-containing protein n=1 Tax=Chromera velia CCMP2878 TaxID=1169474 RepID=A0A0G4FG91_9ALVE|eukprot:Cvel_16794.t1-p1 / transcript=Cvel_16794.t1 / gene=Cvel_16794 / organism=Chromera_velia_CCMP2878 / gene_product=Mitogen-activated protein kinase 1, putative / transcript_product=Mitogen-activated protein kinase 1, putative / location=Cvel_scaffold1311:21117-24071(-) / protein_length=512 / sequence_SO=supercontig / SO=protein_coding / is_pseudo=false
MGSKQTQFLLWFKKSVAADSAVAAGVQAWKDEFFPPKAGVKTFTYLLLRDQTAVVELSATTSAADLLQQYPFLHRVRPLTQDKPLFQRNDVKQYADHPETHLFVHFRTHDDMHKRQRKFVCFFRSSQTDDPEVAARVAEKVDSWREGCRTGVFARLLWLREKSAVIQLRYPFTAQQLLSRNPILASVNPLDAVFGSNPLVQIEMEKREDVLAFSRNAEFIRASPAVPDMSSIPVVEGARKRGIPSEGVPVLESSYPNSHRRRIQEDVERKVRKDTESEADEDAESKFDEDAQSEFDEDAQSEFDEDAESEGDEDAESEGDEDAESEGDEDAQSEFDGDAESEGDEDAESEFDEDAEREMEFRATWPRQLLEGCEILQFVGKGDFGAVYKAMEKSTQQVVALKVTYGAFETPESAARIAWELEVLHQMNSRYIPKLLDVIPPDDTANFTDVAFTMEFLSTKLSDFLEDDVALSKETASEGCGGERWMGGEGVALQRNRKAAPTRHGARCEGTT